MRPFFMTSSKVRSRSRSFVTPSLFIESSTSSSKSTSVELVENVLLKELGAGEGTTDNEGSSIKEMNPSDVSDTATFVDTKDAAVGVGTLDSVAPHHPPFD